MIAVDTNILVYAHRPEMVDHQRARDALAQLTKAGGGWGLPWPCLHEFFAVVTNRRAFADATPPATALGVIGDLLGLLGAWPLGETYHHLALLNDLVATAPSLSGGRIHDARIAAICIGNGVSELWTADRDFGLFPRLKTRNPLVRHG